MKSTDESPAAPIRSFEQIAQRLREAGDVRMNRELARWHHNNAIRKLRSALEAEYGEPQCWS